MLILILVKVLDQGLFMFVAYDGIVGEELQEGWKFGCRTLDIGLWTLDLAV